MDNRPYANVPRRTFFDLSTCHITADDDSLLTRMLSDSAFDAEVDARCGEFYCLAKEHGYILLLGADGISYRGAQELLALGFSLIFVDLLRAVEAAREHDSSVVGVWLDCDADASEDLPSIDWETATITEPLR